MKKRFRGQRVLVAILSVVLLLPQMFLLAAAVGNEPTISVDNVEQFAGETVEVTIVMDNNPGITSALLRVGYNEDVLTLLNVADGGILGAAYHSDKLHNPYTLSWANDTATSNITANGKLVTLTFAISGAIQSEQSLPITVSYDYNNYDIIDKDMNPIRFDTVDGSVLVKIPPVSVTGVSLSEESLSMKTGESARLTAVVTPDNATDKTVLWSSDDTDVATVDENGLVSAKAVGSACITVRTQDGDFTDSCVVTIDCGHQNTIEHPAQPSTCITQGHAAYTTCADCGALLSGSDAKLPLTAHQFAENPEERYLQNAATCVESATYFVSCEVCGSAGRNTFAYGEPNPDNHVGGTYIANQTTATCTQAGYTGDTCCKSCRAILAAGEATEKAPHQPGAWEVTTPADCTNAGEQVQRCTVCKAVVARQTIPATGHSFGAWTVTTPATCTQEGVETRTCACGAAETRVVPAAGHIAGEWEVTTPADCTNAGEQVQRCTVCKAVVARQTIPATGHSFGAWTVTTPATCTQEGVETRTCACGAAETRAIPAAGHTAGDWVTTVPAGCTTEGERVQYCTVCDVVLQKEEIPAAGHAFGEWKVILEATQEQEGLQERVCTACGAVDSKAIPALGTEVTEPTLPEPDDETKPETSVPQEKPEDATQQAQDAQPDIPKTGAVTSAGVCAALALLAAAAGIGAWTGRKKR